MVQSQKDKVAIISEIQKALDDMIFGSVELYVQNRKVTQITVRHIKKTNVGVSEPLSIERTQNEVNVKIGIDK
ncbi:DUF2292 domain-containing protein [Patescibacteria group bacterium]|nr:DUF2292 domain-containing protein [Patescibacteria group bacterium]